MGAECHFNNQGYLSAEKEEMPDWQSEMKAAKTKEWCQRLVFGLVSQQIVLSPSHEEERFKAQSLGLLRCFAVSV